MGCAAWPRSNLPGDHSTRRPAGVQRASGTHVAKRQIEALARRSAVDFKAFYETRRHDPVGDDKVLVMSYDENEP